MKKLIWIQCIFYTLFGNAKEISSITHRFGIDQACKMALESEQSFANFRRMSFCLEIIDYLWHPVAAQILSVICNHYPHLLNNLDQFRKNDSVGNPLLMHFDEFGDFCPATLFYIKIAGDLEKTFGDLNNKTIIEIGGGYGGQCRILSSLFSLKEYIIVDLPEVLELTKKYLDLLDVKNIRYLSHEQLPEELTCDLLLSNFAFCECSPEVQKHYLQKILKHSKYGYMLCTNYTDYYCGPLINTFANELQNEYDVLESFLEDISPSFPKTQNPQEFLSFYLVTWHLKH